MFTGIIESIGKIEEIRTSGTNKTFVVSSELAAELKVDQSIAHDGVCLTVESCDDKMHTVTLIKETLDRSHLNTAQTGDLLNLERCMRLSDRLDGHIVQGHVDTVVTCIDRKDENGSWVFSFNLPEAFKSLIVMKGSICINGISLTVSGLRDDQFSVSIIPYTFDETNMHSLKPGNPVNVEFDILGKYVERQMNHRRGSFKSDS